ncbi:MAG: DUF1549 domain-containing protein, partial [Akkermansiaceae bacterium]|nr:DUF1549 domain-containing protein [Akkermansiaceae bacterium]
MKEIGLALSAFLVLAGVTAAVEDQPEKHWAFQKVVRPGLPDCGGSKWVRNPIDHFALRGLEGRDLRPSPPASRTEFIRRVTFDFLGLPPTPDQVDAFLDDSSNDAYENLIDRLLASPRFGERWGRHWLDVVRFAQTNG